MARKRHSKKEIEAVVDYALDLGWTLLEPAGGHTHVWGSLICPRHDREGCIIRIYSTPQNPQNFANRLRREIDRCEHTAPIGPEVDDEEESDEDA